MDWIWTGSPFSRGIRVGTRAWAVATPPVLLDFFRRDEGNLRPHCLLEATRASCFCRSLNNTFSIKFYLVYLAGLPDQFVNCLSYRSVTPASGDLQPRFSHGKKLITKMLDSKKLRMHGAAHRSGKPSTESQGHLKTRRCASACSM